MSVFEDLIGELKSENLLEDTVIDLNRADIPAANGGSTTDGDVFAGASAPGEAVSSLEQHGLPGAGQREDDQEFYRKRAMDEISTLQMVGHVFSGIEREHMQLTPDPFDDLDAKKALHRFLQVSAEPGSREHAEAEFALRNETEAWNLTLYSRDRSITVSNVRRFCEESRPVLSSSALIALARFYRNSPYAEEVRGKFDYVMTRLFSRETEDGLRQLLFGHEEMIGHINDLYANWSSIALYSSDEDQAEVSLTVARFGEFVSEICDAGSFGDLLASEFFSRLRSYKEECSEMFYVSEVLAAAMTCNIAVGNRYVELIARERMKRGADLVEDRYGADHDQTVSDAVARTLVLTDVLALDIDVSLDDTAKPAWIPAAPAPQKAKSVNSKAESGAGSRANVFGINRRLALFCAVLLLAALGVYVWAEQLGGPGETGTPMATSVVIEVPDADKYLRSPRYTNNTLYAMTEPAFETLTETEQKEFIEKVRGFANSKSLDHVVILDPKGKTLAVASKGRVEFHKQ